MTRALIVVILLATLLGCGRVGPPVRRPPAAEPGTVQAAEEENEEKEKQP